MGRGRLGYNSKGINIWADSAKFDRFYDNRKSGIRYSQLNYIASGLSPMALWNIQKNNLRKLINDNQDLKTTINQIVKNLPKDVASFQQDEASVTEESIGKNVYSRTIEILNALLLGKPGTSETTYSKFRAAKFDKNTMGDYKEFVAEINSLYQELSSYYEKGYIDKRSLLLFKARAGRFIQGNSSSRGLAESFHDYIGRGATRKAYEELKYRESEYLLDEMINNLFKGIFGSINSGAFQSAAGQLIEDAFIYQKSAFGETQFANGGILTFSTTGKKSATYTATTWEEFERKVKELNNKKISITLDDEAYDLLKRSKALSVQVKSHRGGPDSIINQNERFTITGKEIQLEQMLLVDLINRYNPVSLDHKADDTNLAVVANWYLSRNIIKTKLIENDLYFTEEGLETAAEWMDRKRKMLTLTADLTNANLYRQAINANNKYAFISVPTKF